MKRSFVALSSLALFLSSFSLQAESLRDIYELALTNDAQLKSEKATYLARRETEALSRAALLPQITASYSYSNSDTESEGLSRDFQNPDPDGTIPVVGSSTDADIDTDGYRLSLNQTLFDLPAWFSFQSGREVSKEAESTFAANQQNLILRVVEAYLSVLRSQDNLSASKAQERAFERQLEQTQQRFEVGLIAITDVYEAQAARDLAQVERIVDENNLSVALENLSVLTGQSHSNLAILNSDFQILPPDPIDRSAWVDFALQNNFALQASRYREEAARQTAKAKKLEHAPKLTGGIEISDFETQGEQNFEPDTGFIPPPDGTREETSWQLNLSVPLFSGGAVSANRRKAAQEFNVAKEERIRLMRSTITNTRSLHMTVISDVSRIRARQQSIISSESSLDATQAGYEVGTRNVVDVLNAQNSLFSARRDFANSRYDYILTMMRLQEQAGLLSPKDINKLDEYLEVAAATTASGQ